MIIQKVQVYVTEDITYRTLPGASYEDAARSLLKSKLHRLIDDTVDKAELEETKAVSANASYFTMKLAYDKKGACK